MKLPRATEYLEALRIYLKRSGVKLPKGLRVKHDPACDRSNARSARAFAFVEDGSPVIHCSEAIECLLGRAVAGVLLHEIGHVVVGANHDDPEVATDEWIAYTVPEAGYHYRAIRYVMPGQKKAHGPFWRRIAKSLECVSPQFITALK